MKIRNDIYYYRFIGIMSIILYHLNQEIFCGGYIGVDILLILTGLLNIDSFATKYSNINQGCLKFIIARSKRLIPSSLLVLILCKNYIHDNLEIPISLLFLSNYYYYQKNVDYFYQFDKPSPILHYWCLSLEYQFYLIIPFVLKIKYSFIIIVSLILLSLFLFLQEMHKDLSYCYYCFLPRLYQFLATYFINTKSVYNYSFSTIFIYAFLHILILSFCSEVYVEIHLFHCLFTCIYIHKNYLEISKFNILIYFTKISYSLYLCHYPLIIIFKRNIIVTVIMIFISAILLHYLYEMQISKLCEHINNLVLILCYIVVIIVSFKKYFYKVKKNIKVAANSKKLWDDFMKYRKPCTINESYSNCKKILFMGDSHSDQWINGIYKYFLNRNLLIYHITISGISDIPNMKFENIIEQVRKLKYIELIVLCNFKHNIEFNKRYKFINNFDIYYLTLQKKLLNYSNNIVILNDNPHLNSPAYICLNSKSSYCYCILGNNCTISNIPIYKNKRIRKCDLNSNFCINGKCNYVKDNIVVYVDSHHLTPYIVKYLSKDLLKCLNYRGKENSNKCIIFNNKCIYYEL